MAYDQSKLISDVRIYLGGVGEDKLPESVIIYWGDFFDADPKYTGDYPHILQKTTLCCIQHLKTNLITSGSAAKSSRKEKIGDVEVTVAEEGKSEEGTLAFYDDLTADYLKNPWKFGITIESGTGVVLINGVNQAEVDRYRNNNNTTSTYNPLPVTAFPKVTGCTWRRNNTSRGRR